MAKSEKAEKAPQAQNAGAASNPQPQLKKLCDNIYVFYSPTNAGVAAFKAPDGVAELYFVDACETLEDAKKLMDACGREFGDFRLKAVIFTHAHADHIGGAAWLKQKTSCQIWASQAEKSCAETPQIQAQAFYGGDPIPEIDIPYFHAPQVFVDRVIAAGQKISIGGGPGDGGLEFEFVALPGHSLEMLGILTAAGGKKVFFSGDGIFGRHMLNRFWTPFIIDIKAFKESILRVEKIKADYYVPSHGESYERIEELCELNLISTLSNEKFIEGLLNEPRTLEDLLKLFCDKSGIKLKPSQFMLIGGTLRSYLTYLYKEGRAKWYFEENKMYWQKVAE